MTAPARLSSLSGAPRAEPVAPSGPPVGRNPELNPRLEAVAQSKGGNPRSSLAIARDSVPASGFQLPSNPSVFEGFQADFSLIIDPPMPPQANMDRDEEMAQSVRDGRAPATLRIYRWNQSAISLGRRQNPHDLPAALLRQRLPIVQRPTGGGAVVHSVDELTYAAAFPRAFVMPGVRLNQIPTLVHRQLRDELVNRGSVLAENLLLQQEDSPGPYTFCFSTPVCGDLFYRGKKIAGAALRAWRECLLIQGSIQGFPIAYSELVNLLPVALRGGFQDERVHFAEFYCRRR